MTFKVIDLFAGPGGLGEGFSALKDGTAFGIALSAEMDPSAHSTLILRSFFRKIQGDQKALKAYYSFCETSSAPHPKESAAKAWEAAAGEAHQITLGVVEDNRYFDELIRKEKLLGDRTILIGGPPCQAYSLVGRSRNAGKANYVAEEDHRHYLYKEYLRILNLTKPTVFVMENVKGILSSRVGGRQVFHDILRDLTNPGQSLGKRDGPSYTIHSLVSQVKFSPGDDPAQIDPTSFTIKSEKFGIPQARHRVILIGVRTDLNYDGRFVLSQSSELSVKDAIDDLPPLRSKLSTCDSETDWCDAVRKQAMLLHKDAHKQRLEPIALALLRRSLLIGKHLETGGLRCGMTTRQALKPSFGKWVSDPKLNVWLNHESRSHMSSDLARYFYASVFADTFGRSPKGPSEFSLRNLAPNHANWESGKFSDRFRVQRFESPSTTITSHISKDGHYFIHPDPEQCRSLTVREAARLQTFPDNYFFQGNRTQQYHQVGNAVPPLLANQIAEVVYKIVRG